MLFHFHQSPQLGWAASSAGSHAACRLGCTRQWCCQRGALPEPFCSHGHPLQAVFRGGDSQGGLYWPLPNRSDGAGSVMVATVKSPISATACCFIRWTHQLLLCPAHGSPTVSEHPPATVPPVVPSPHQPSPKQPVPGVRVRRQQ